MVQYLSEAWSSETNCRPYNSSSLEPSRCHGRGRERRKTRVVEILRGLQGGAIQVSGRGEEYLSCTTEKTIHALLQCKHWTYGWVRGYDAIVFIRCSLYAARARGSLPHSKLDFKTFCWGSIVNNSTTGRIVRKT